MGAWKDALAKGLRYHRERFPVTREQLLWRRHVDFRLDEWRESQREEVPIEFGDDSVQRMPLPRSQPSSLRRRSTLCNIFFFSFRIHISPTEPVRAIEQGDTIETKHGQLATVSLAV